MRRDEHLTASATMPADDAELLRLCARLIAINEEYRALSEPFFNVAGGPPADVAASIHDRVAQYHDLRAQIAPIKALTMAGLRAKARIALMELDADEDQTDTDVEVSVSLCRDLVMLGNG